MGTHRGTDPEMEGLRWRIMGILYSDGCKKINFTVDNINVRGWMYGYVADLIDRGSISIKKAAPSGEAGQYLPSYDTLIFPWADGLDGQYANSRRETVVHECTHAGIDATREGKSTAYLSGEAAGWLAGVVYLINAGRSYPKDNNDFTASLFAMATEIADANKKGSWPAANPKGVAYIKKQLAVVYSKARGRKIDENYTETMDGIRY